MMKKRMKGFEESCLKKTKHASINCRQIHLDNRSKESALQAKNSND